jgi:SAM-dependent methyltransferase
MELKKERYDDFPIRTEQDLLKELLPTTAPDTVWIELGCGPAKATQTLAVDLPQIRILAYEIDEQQHAKNLALSSCPPNLVFGKAGMQDFPIDNDNSVDAVIMLKSLHHVPQEFMKDGFHRIHRVLKPGGKLFICEPVFHGEFNEILRLFHDEEKVRSDAFDTMKQMVESGVFQLEQELHFRQETVFPRGFLDFDEKILQSTFNDFKLTPEVLSTVKERFQKHEKEDGSASFLMPLRVDLLVKKGE